MKTLLRLIAIFTLVWSTPSFSQTTHLNSAVKQMVRIVFGHNASDPQGTYRGMYAQFGDDAVDSDWKVPEGMTLVITDISLAGTNDGNAQAKEGLFWICAWELANPGSTYLNFRMPITVRVEANTQVSVLSRSYTGGLTFNHDWQPAILDLMNAKNQSDITLAFVRPMALGYLISSK